MRQARRSSGSLTTLAIASVSRRQNSVRHRERGVKGRLGIPSMRAKQIRPAAERCTGRNARVNIIIPAGMTGVVTVYASRIFLKLEQVKKMVNV